MILRLLTDLKIEQQALRDTLKNIQSTLATLEKKDPQKNSILTKRHQISGFPTSFHDWRASRQNN